VTHLRGNRGFVRLVLSACFILCLPSLKAQQADAPLTMDAALAYARQHSPRLFARKQGLTTEQAAISTARAERLPRLTLNAAARGSSQTTQTAMGGVRKGSLRPIILPELTIHNCGYQT
jgi:outer membrane protein TolC